MGKARHSLLLPVLLAHGFVKVQMPSCTVSSLMLLDNDRTQRLVSMPLSLIPDGDFRPRVT